MSEEIEESLEYFESRKGSGWNHHDHGNVLATALRQSQARVKEMEKAIHWKDEALRFFRSVIKSGEEWSSMCERAMTLAALPSAGKEVA